MASTVNEFRRRAEYESPLLMQRSQIILTLNMLALIAVNIANFEVFHSVIAGTLIIINLLWIWCGSDASRFLKFLNDEESSLISSQQTVSEVVRINKFLPGRIRPTFIIAVVIPIILEFMWLAALILKIALGGSDSDL